MNVPTNEVRSDLPARYRVGRVLAVIAGVLLLLVGGAMTAAGVAQGSGYFTTPYGEVQSPTAAMVTREIDVEGRRPTDPQNDPGDLARVRVQVRPQGDKPVFVGIARRADVERYLAGTAHDEMSTFDLEPLRVSFQRHPGAATATPPADQDFWEASATGSGPLELQWDKRLGEYMAVAMNADGTPDVSIAATIGLRFGFLLPVGLPLLVLGALVLIVLMATRGRTRKHSRTTTRTEMTSW